MQRKSHVRTRAVEKGSGGSKRTSTRARKAPAGVEASYTPEAESAPGPDIAATPGNAGHTTEEGRLDMVTPEAVADELRAIPIDGEDAGPGVPDGQAVAATETTFIGEDAFFAGFVAAHQIPGHAMGLQTLVIAPDQPTARPASDAIYRICCRTPSLYFLVQPGSQWVADAAAIAMFAVPMLRSVRTEIAAKKAARKPKGPIEKPGSERPPVEYPARDQEEPLADG